MALLLANEAEQLYWKPSTKWALWFWGGDLDDYWQLACVDMLTFQVRIRPDEHMGGLNIRRLKPLPVQFESMDAAMRYVEVTCTMNRHLS